MKKRTRFWSGVKFFQLNFPFRHTCTCLLAFVISSKKVRKNNVGSSTKQSHNIRIAISETEKKRERESINQSKNADRITLSNVIPTNWSPIIKITAWKTDSDVRNK